MSKSSPERILRNAMRGKVDGDELNDLLSAINRDLKSEWIRELLKSDCSSANSSGVFLLEEYVGDAISLYDVAIPLQSEIDPWKRRVFVGYVIKQDIFNEDIKNAMRKLLTDTDLYVRAWAIVWACTISDSAFNEFCASVFDNGLSKFYSDYVTLKGRNTDREKRAIVFAYMVRSGRDIGEIEEALRFEDGFTFEFFRNRKRKPKKRA